MIQRIDNLSAEKTILKEKMKVSQMVLFRYCLNSQTNSYLSKRRARLLIESFLRFRNLLFAIGKQKKLL